MEIQFEEVRLNRLSKLREYYFKEIRLPQEFYIELLVSDGIYYKMLYNQKTAGYFITSSDNTLVEFHLLKNFVRYKEPIFEQAINRYWITNAYCKSFDNLMMSCCHTIYRSSRVIGILYRNYSETPYNGAKQNLDVRLAGSSDIPLLSTFGNSGLFESIEELQQMVSEHAVYLFEKQQSIVGCGFLSQITPKHNYYDIGMWVNPDFRLRGHSSQIVAYLKSLCLENGYIPVCGCGADNKASRKVLELNGFYSKYVLIDFEFDLLE